ncbi:MAG TPA: hypothetical protein GX519_04440, partial [Thermoanaerobacterales bacterium]|nr:hypothetical protein [Thermoanaerobacterales bacterium]
MRRRSFILFLGVVLIITILSNLFIGCRNGKQAAKDGFEEMWQGVITLWDFPRWPDKNGNRFGWIEKKIA